MKALTLTQPWATLVAIGAKKIETRSWYTSYRGPLAIHAAAGLDTVGGRRGLRELAFGQSEFRNALFAGLFGGQAVMPDELTSALPLGAIVAVCELRDCITTTHFKNVKIIRRQRDRSSASEWLWTENEKAFGDYSTGRWAWLLADIRKLDTPIPCKGALSLWDCEVSL